MSETEADTLANRIDPVLRDAGWDVAEGSKIRREMICPGRITGGGRVNPISADYVLSYPKDFFDLIVIDECHRGGARDDRTWRGILEYFSPAVQLGLTATPKRDVNADTYGYFGEAHFGTAARAPGAGRGRRTTNRREDRREARRRQGSPDPLHRRDDLLVP